MRDRSMLARLLSKAVVRGEVDCWEWTASLNRKGYGFFRQNGKLRTAHRVMWEIENGPLTGPEQVVMHTCDNRKCINPNHLATGTQRDNMYDMLMKGRQHSASKAKPKVHGNAILTPDQVREIRRLHGFRISAPRVAEQFGVTPMAIYDIWHKGTWKDVT